MNTHADLYRIVDSITVNSAKLNFQAGCDKRVAELCGFLAGDTQYKRLLELGTGTGLSTAYIRHSMPAGAYLDTVDFDPKVSASAKQAMMDPANVNFIVECGGAYLNLQETGTYDFIFADAWPGKYSHLDQALRILKKGGVYLIDDLLPQKNWPENHQPRVDRIIELFSISERFDCVQLDWGSGVAIIRKVTEHEGLEDKLVDDERFEFLFGQEIP